MNSAKIRRRDPNLLRQTALIAFSAIGMVRVGLAQSPDEPLLAEPEPKIALIETYGLRTVSRSEVIEAAGIKVGDDLRDVDMAQAIDRIENIAGVRKAATAGIYGPLLKEGELGLVLYLGIEDEGSQPLQFGTAPSLDRALPVDVVSANDREQRAFKIAATKGQFGEDGSQGHSLSADPELRSAQEQYVLLATTHWDALVDVLHNSRDSTQRAIAAKVIAYAKNKERVVHELVPMLHDPASEVRNNATRALSLIFSHANSQPDTSIAPPVELVERLIEMLDSLVWTDRNKAIALLLSIDDEALVVNELREQAVPSLIEMSGWQSAHGAMAFMLLGRLVDMTHDESRLVWQRGEQASVIARVQEASAIR